MIRKHWLTLAILALFMAAFPTQALAGATAYTIIERFDLTGTTFPPYCGETLEFISGSWNSVFHVTFDDAGSYHLSAHDNLRNAVLVGQDSGVIYRGGAAYKFNWNGRVGETTSWTATIRFTGQGQADDIFIQIVEHITVTPDGNVNVKLTQDRLICE